jgi:hypothetical protein
MKPAVLLSLLLPLLALTAGSAWGRRDPLNTAEIAELREVAQQPDKRLPLYVKFIRERVESLQQLHSDPRFAPGREMRIHDLLEEVDSLLQELDDNINAYVRQEMDVRKPLKAVIEMDGELQRKLRAMKQHSPPEGLKIYGLALDFATDSATESLDNAQRLAQAQEEAVKKPKQQR